ncbi:MAG: hypothetical protein C0622_05360, partial [Desulfuromonas sp.]
MIQHPTQTSSPCSSKSACAWWTLAVFLLLTSLSSLIIYSSAQTYREHHKAAALQLAGAEAGKLSQLLNASTSLTYSLETILRQRDFQVDQA